MKSVVVLKNYIVAARYICGIDGSEERCKTLANDAMNRMRLKDGHSSFDVASFVFKNGRWNKIEEAQSYPFGF